MAPDDSPDLDPKLTELIRKAVEEVRSEFQRKLQETRDRLEKLVRGEEPEMEAAESGLEDETPAVEAPEEEPSTREGTAEATTAPSPTSDDLLAAIAVIDRSRSQTEILTALLEAARGKESRAALFLMKSDGLLGWAAAGFGDADEAFSGHSVGYGEDTPWARLAEGKGSVELNAAHCDVLCDGLGVPGADGGLLVPLVLRDSLAAAVYVDRADASAVIDPASLQVVTYVAAQALETLPLRGRAATATLLWSEDAAEDDPGLPLWEGAAVAVAAVAAADLLVEEDQPAAEEDVREEPIEEVEEPPEPAAETEEADTPDEDVIEEGTGEPTEFVADEEPGEVDPAPETAAPEEAAEEAADEEIVVDAEAPTPWNLVETAADESAVDESDEEAPADQEARVWVEPDQDDFDDVPEETVEEPATEADEPVVIEEDDVPDVEAPDEEATEEPSEEPAPEEEAGEAETVTEEAPDEVAAVEDPQAEVPVAAPEEEETPEPEAPPATVTGFSMESIPAPELEGPDPYEEDAETLGSQDGGYTVEPAPWPITGETIPVDDSLYRDDEPEQETTDAEDVDVEDAAPVVQPEDQEASAESESSEETPAPEDEPAEPADDPVEPPQDELAALSPDEPPGEPVADIPTDMTQPVDVPVTGIPGSGTQVTPPEDIEGPGWAFSAAGSMADGSLEARQEEARRLARLLVTEIKLYNEEQVAEGRVQGSIYHQLKDDIDRSRVIFEERVEEDVRQERDYFRDELVRILAGGDESVLGD